MEMDMTFKTLLPAAALVALLATPAAAQNLAALQKACMGDVRALCAGIQPGGGRIKDCLMAKADQVSPQCKSAMSEAAQAAQAAGGTKN
jgi:hypothetical protein